MGCAISMDWQEEFNKNYDKWVNHGRYALENNCKHNTQDKDKQSNRETNMRYSGWCEECGTSEDSGIPMMNYAYPLELTSFDDDQILKVVQETNCTVLENQETGEWFLALCGGGMDLSQDIAYSYIIMETWMPDDLLSNVCIQPMLSISKEKYKVLANQIIRQFELRAIQFENKAKEWKKELEKETNG